MRNGAMFFLECTIGPSWAVPMDVGGKCSGTISGMMNMAGNIGGALSPIVFGVLVQFGSWQAPFDDEDDYSSASSTTGTARARSANPCGSLRVTSRP
jgi:hypothetical protein